MAALIRFPAVDIQIDGLDIDLELPADWMRKAFAETEVSPGEEPGRISGRLSRSGTDIVVRAKLKAQVELPCARCLDPASFDVASELSLLLQPKARAQGSRSSRASGRGGDDDGYEFSAAEADLDVYDGETVILDSFVREAILLEVPNFPLCRDSCPGMQVAAAVAPIEEARAFDPRLAPLDAFRDKSDDPVTVEDLVAAAQERSASLRGRKPILRANQAGPSKRGKKKR